MLAASPWSGLEPAHIGFCEARLGGWIAEPANAWSSLAYVAVGAYLLARAQRRSLGPLALVGVTAALVGAGSFAFHATASFLGEYADESSMFLISALMITLACRRLLGWDFAKSVRVYALVVVSAMALLAIAHGSGVVVFTLHIAVAMAIELWLWRIQSSAADYRPLRATLFVFAAAYLAWWLDLGKVVCDPNNHAFGGHAVWHSLTALSLALYQRFQEQFPVAPVPVPVLVPVPLPEPPLTAESPLQEAIEQIVESIRSIRLPVASVSDFN